MNGHNNLVYAANDDGDMLSASLLVCEIDGERTCHANSGKTCARSLHEKERENVQSYHLGALAASELCLLLRWVRLWEVKLSI